MKKLLLILLCLGLVGCAGTGFDYGVKRQQSMNTAKRNNQNMARLSIGMLKEDAIAIMGSPDKTEAYSLGDKQIEFLLYRTQAVDGALDDVDANFTPVAIEKGKVIGWGRNFYDQTIKLKLEIKRD